MLVRCLALLSLLLLGTACSSDDGSAPSPDANLAAADADPSGVLEFMSECDIADDRCDEASEEFCFAFNDKGPHCTRPCQTPEECEAPSTGCNNRGVCKAP